MNRFMQPLRILVQWLFLLFMLFLGMQLYRFVAHFRSGGTLPFVPRPDGVEGFLPISALLSLKQWIVSGAIHPAHPAALVILLTVIGVSLLLKRSFCSWICPVGTVSELLWKTGFTLLRGNGHLPRWFDLGLRGIKYLLMAFFLYSILVAMPSAALESFINSDYNKIADVRLLEFFLNLSGTALIVVLVLLLLSIPLRNPFCRFLCPYGALLGIVSVLSPLKVTRNGEACVSCGACNAACPSGIRVMEKKRVHSEECIGCWRCISHCRVQGALEMKLTGRRIAVPGLVFALMVVGVFWGGTLIGKVTGHWRTGTSIEEYRRLLGPAAGGAVESRRTISPTPHDMGD